MAQPRKVREKAALADTLIARAAEGKTVKTDPPRPAVQPALAIVTDPPEGAPVGSQYAIAPPAEPAPNLVAPAVAPGPEGWEHKFNVLKGMFDKQRGIDADSIQQLRNQINTLMKMADKPTTIQDTFHPDTPPQAADYGMSEDEMEALGGQEFIESIRKISAVGAAPAIAALTSEVTDLKKNQLNTAEDIFYSQLDQLCPDWAAINKNDLFEAWLMESEGLSGIPRRNFLTSAYDDRDAVTAARYFNSFKADATSPPILNPDVLQDVIPLNSGGGSNLSPTVTGTIYSTDSINKFYKDVGLGRFRGREDEAKAIEMDIYAAQNEGRIILKKRA